MASSRKKRVSVAEKKIEEVEVLIERSMDDAEGLPLSGGFEGISFQRFWKVVATFISIRSGVIFAGLFYFFLAAWFSSRDSEARANEKLSEIIIAVVRIFFAASAMTVVHIAATVENIATIVVTVARLWVGHLLPALKGVFKTRMAAENLDYVPWKQWYPEVSAISGLQRDLDIVFFHGLQGPQWGDGRDVRENAWTNSAGVCWPKLWLYKALEVALKGRRVRIGGVHYSAQASSFFSGLMGTSADGHEKIAKSLFHGLVTPDGCMLGTKPFVLVGHSYGGIVIESLVVYCDDLIKRSKGGDAIDPEALAAATRFMANFKGYIFYGVPQRGSKLADTAYVLNRFIPFRFGRTVEYDLRPLDDGIAELTNKFGKIVRDRHDITRFAFGEAMPIGFWFCKRLVVPRASSKGELDETQYLELVGTDHVSMAKPNSRDGQAFTKCVTILKKIIEALPPVDLDPLPAPGAPRHSFDISNGLNSQPEFSRCRHLLLQMLPSLLSLAWW